MVTLLQRMLSDAQDWMTLHVFSLSHTFLLTSRTSPLLCASSCHTFVVLKWLNYPLIKPTWCSDQTDVPSPCRGRFSFEPLDLVLNCKRSISPTIATSSISQTPFCPRFRYFCFPKWLISGGVKVFLLFEFCIFWRKGSGSEFRWWVKRMACVRGK